MLDFISRDEMPVVLLIDDDMVTREVMATVLTMSGYPVHTAADGQAAVALLEQKACSPNAILMDAQMPGLSGVPLIDQLRQLTPAPLFVMSASAAPAEVVAAADGFLLKPFNPDALGALLGDRAAEKNPTAPGLDPAESIVNPETLAQLREMMPEAAVKQIYQAIVADLDRRITALEAAIAVSDWPEVRRLGHTIKGGGVMAGAVQIARLGELVESGTLTPRAAPPGAKVTTPVNQSDNSIALLADLRAAGANLQRMLDAEFKA